MYLKDGLKLMLVATLLVSSGCASHKVANIDEFQSTVVEKSKYAPSIEQMNRGKHKVVVFALDESGNEVAEQAQLGLSLAGNIEATLTEAKTAELVDRQIAERLKEEIKLAEMNNSGAYDGPIIADYAIAGSLTNAAFTHKFIEATSWVDKKGRLHQTPPSFRYTAEVDGILKVYEIPSMKVVRTIKFSDNKGRSEETRSASRYVERDDDLVRGAARDAISSIKAELKNQFAPQAYIIDKRVKDAKAVFKINLGLEQGAKPGDKCEIFTIRESVNQLTGEVETEKQKVCDAVITDQLSSNSSWIVASVKESSQVKLGDEIKIVYSKSTGEYLKDAGSLMNTILAK